MRENIREFIICIACLYVVSQSNIQISLKC